MHVNNTKNLVLQDALLFYYEEFVEYTKYNNYLAKSITNIFSLSRFRKNYKFITKFTSELNNARTGRTFFSIDYYVGNSYSSNVNILRFSKATYYNNH